MTRQKKTTIIFVFLFLSVPVLLGSFVLTSTWPTIGPWVVDLGMVLTLFSFYLHGRIVSDLASEVHAANHRICPGCEYSLKGHDEVGRCPECGKDFTPESLRRDWKRILRKRYIY